MMTEEKYDTFALGPVQKTRGRINPNKPRQKKDGTVIPPAYFEMTFRLDDIAIRISRSEYTFNMWFAAIGGIENMYSRIFGIMVWGMTYKTFINAVMGSLFLMKKGRDPEDELDPDDPNSANWVGKKGFALDDPKKKKNNRFVTRDEATDYKALKHELEVKKTVSMKSVRNIIMHMF